MGSRFESSDFEINIRGLSLMPRVLIIDDQKDVRAMVAIVLRVNRFEAVEAESGAAGLKAFDEGPFDAAIVDIFLGDTSGGPVRPARGAAATPTSRRPAWRTPARHPPSGRPRDRGRRATQRAPWSPP